MENYIPAGKKVCYEDDLVRVYDAYGHVVYYGLLDYCPYKRDDWKWCDTEKCYKLPNGYKMIGV